MPSPKLGDALQTTANELSTRTVVRCPGIGHRDLRASHRAGFLMAKR